MSFVAPEQLAAKQLRQLEQQTAEVKRFNTNIAMEIADAMASKLEASVADGLRRAIEPLTRAVERLSEGMTDDNRGALIADGGSIPAAAETGSRARAGGSWAGASPDARRLGERNGEIRESK